MPGDRPDRVEKAIASPAHAVIVDLEDGVAPEGKAAARSNLGALLGAALPKPVYLRINALGSGHAEADLAALAGLTVAGVHVPKVESPDDIRAVLELLPEPRPIHGLIESAAGVEAAFDIARGGAAGISLGEADLRSETGALEAGLDWARGRVINAAVAAGLPRPPQSVYPRLDDDDEGLLRSSQRGRELGHFGRTAIHPRQLSVIEQAYLPTEEEVVRARATVERLEQALGAARLSGGDFVDAAMLGSARQVLALADRYGTGAG